MNKTILENDIRILKGLIATLEADLSQIHERSKEREDKIRGVYSSLENISLKAEVLQEINELVGLDLELDELLSLIMDSILRLMQTDAGSILLLDKTRTKLIFKIAKGPKAEEVKKFDIPLGEGIVGWVAAEEEPIIIPNPLEDKRFKKEIAEEIGYLPYNLLCVPLRSKKRVIGVIELINTLGKESFTQDDKDLLLSVSNQIGILIENATLFHDLVRRVSEKTVLTEVARTVNSSLSVDNVLEISMKLVSQIMRAEASSLMILDAKKKELIFKVALGKKGKEVKEIRIPLGSGIAGYVAEHGEPLVIPDVTVEERFFKDVDEKSGFKTRSIICVPLKIKDKLIGVAEAINRIGGVFSPDDIELFEALAFQISIALENASLYKELEDLFISIITSLTATIDAKDQYTHGHSQRVMEYSVAIGKEMGLYGDEIKTLKLSALLHDIGKIGVDEAILRKPGKLTDEEFQEIKKHPGIGARIIEHVKKLKEILPSIKHHHERFEGGGYPDGLSKEKIPLFSRIIAVADAYDAMTSERPYRKALDRDIAISEIERCRGTQFDERCADAFVSAYKKGEIKSKEEIELVFNFNSI